MLPLARQAGHADMKDLAIKGDTVRVPPQIGVPRSACLKSCKPSQSPHQNGMKMVSGPQFPIPIARMNAMILQPSHAKWSENIALVHVIQDPALHRVCRVSTGDWGTVVWYHPWRIPGLRDVAGVSKSEISPRIRFRPPVKPSTALKGWMTRAQVVAMNITKDAHTWCPHLLEKPQRSSRNIPNTWGNLVLPIKARTRWWSHAASHGHLAPHSEGSWHLRTVTRWWPWPKCTSWSTCNSKCSNSKCELSKSAKNPTLCQNERIKRSEQPKSSHLQGCCSWSPNRTSANLQGCGPAPLLSIPAVVTWSPTFTAASTVHFFHNMAIHSYDFQHFGYGHLPNKSIQRLKFGCGETWP